MQHTSLKTKLVSCILFISYTCTHSHIHIAPANSLSMHLFIAVKTLDLAKYLPPVHEEGCTGNPEALSASRSSCQLKTDQRNVEVPDEERGKKVVRRTRKKRQYSSGGQ